MLNKHRGILKYHLLNNYLCKLNRGLVPIDPKRYISRICCLFYGGRSCIQIHMFVRNMPHSPVTVNLSGMLDRRKLRIKYLYYLYDAFVCIYKKNTNWLSSCWSKTFVYPLRKFSDLKEVLCCLDNHTFFRWVLENRTCYKVHYFSNTEDLLQNRK